MYLKNRFNLYRLKKSLGPSQEFKVALHRNLNSAWKSKYGTSPWYQMWMLRPVAAVIAIVLVLVGGGGAYAYNNPQVTEGTPLYPIKQAIETVEEATKITPEAKAEFYLKKIERREAEREVLKKKNVIAAIKTESQNNSRVDVVSPKITAEAEIEQLRIRKTEKSIEQAEQKLEQSGKILEQNGSKNIKLRTEIKNRVEQRIEERKKQLKDRIELQKNRQENRREIREDQKGSLPETL